MAKPPIGITVLIKDGFYKGRIGTVVEVSESIMLSERPYKVRIRGTKVIGNRKGLHIHFALNQLEANPDAIGSPSVSPPRPTG